MNDTRKLATKIYLNYNDLYSKLVEKYRAKIGIADKRIGCNGYTFLCAHNWGNLESQKLLDRLDKVSSWLHQRETREYNKALHLDHIAWNQVGEYLWCKDCQKSNPS